MPLILILFAFPPLGAVVLFLIIFGSAEAGYVHTTARSPKIGAAVAILIGAIVSVACLIENATPAPPGIRVSDEAEFIGLVAALIPLGLGMGVAVLVMHTAAEKEAERLAAAAWERKSPAEKEIEILKAEKELESYLVRWRVHEALNGHDKGPNL